jgi:hypothetical protein
MNIKDNMDIDDFNKIFFDDKLDEDYLLDENYYTALLSDKNLVKYLNSELHKWDERLLFCRGRAYHYGEKCKWEIISNDRAQWIVSDRIVRFLINKLIKNKQLQDAMGSLPKPESEKVAKIVEKFLQKQ